VEVRISKSGHTTEFLTAYVIKNLQQPILSRQVLRELGIIPQEFPFVQLSIGNGADFGGKSIEKLEHLGGTGTVQTPVEKRPKV
jgi:hypothetical protein